MNRRLSTIILLVVATFVAGQAHAAKGVFMVVKGKITVETTAGKSFEAKVGSQINSGDSVSAEKDSRAKIVMEDKNVINVSPESKLKLEKYEFDEAKDKKNVVLNLMYGKMRSSVNQKYDGEKNKFNVKTPSAVAGVRGTDFMTSFDSGSKVSQVVTFEGSVAVASGVDSSGKLVNPVVVNPGTVSSVAQNGNPSPPVAMPKAQLQALNNETKAETASSGSQEKSDTKSNTEGEKKEDKKDKKEEAKKEASNDKKDGDKKEDAKKEEGKKEASADKKEGDKAEKQDSKEASKGDKGGGQAKAAGDPGKGNSPGGDSKASADSKPAGGSQAAAGDAKSSAASPGGPAAEGSREPASAGPAPTGGPNPGAAPGGPMGPPMMGAGPEVGGSMGGGMSGGPMPGGMMIDTGDLIGKGGMGPELGPIMGNVPDVAGCAVCGAPPAPLQPPPIIQLPPDIIQQGNANLIIRVKY